MARPSTGTVVADDRGDITRYSLRFVAGGKRRHKALGAVTLAEAEQALIDELVLVRLGLWKPPTTAPPIEEAKPEETFHKFASSWYASRGAEGLADKTLVDLRATLTNHLLPPLRRVPIVRDHRSRGRRVQGGQAARASADRSRPRRSLQARRTIQRSPTQQQLDQSHGTHLGAGARASRRVRAHRLESRRRQAAPLEDVDTRAAVRHARGAAGVPRSSAGRCRPCPSLDPRRRRPPHRGSAEPPTSRRRPRRRVALRTDIVVGRGRPGG
jgi:hypothetical protein